MLKMKKKAQEKAQALLALIVDVFRFEAQYEENLFSASVIKALDEEDWILKSFVSLTGLEYEYRAEHDELGAQDVEVLDKYIADPSAGVEALNMHLLEGFTNGIMQVIAVNTELPKQRIMQIIVHEVNHVFLSHKKLHDDEALNQFYLEYYAFLAERIYAEKKCTPDKLMRLAKEICNTYQLPWEKVVLEKRIWLHPKASRILPAFPKASTKKYLRTEVPELFPAPRRADGVLFYRQHRSCDKVEKTKKEAKKHSSRLGVRP
ncbi:MAG: hypothetical protein CMF48_00615 [Legionellales bacterium]|nr:hypothetical protein [Legionellales bacterium]|tara:strand:+ start:245 stop:1030 length:786 start_codon:yes stop_codon:yes gene_type:complete